MNKKRIGNGPILDEIDAANAARAQATNAGSTVSYRNATSATIPLDGFTDLGVKPVEPTKSGDAAYSLLDEHTQVCPGADLSAPQTDASAGEIVWLKSASNAALRTLTQTGIINVPIAENVLFIKAEAYSANVDLDSLTYGEAEDAIFVRMLTGGASQYGARVRRLANMVQAMKQSILAQTNDTNPFYAMPRAEIYDRLLRYFTLVYRGLVTSRNIRWVLANVDTLASQWPASSSLLASAYNADMRVQLTNACVVLEQQLLGKFVDPTDLSRYLELGQIALAPSQRGTVRVMVPSTASSLDPFAGRALLGNVRSLSPDVARQYALQLAKSLLGGSVALVSAALTPFNSYPTLSKLEGIGADGSKLASALNACAGISLMSVATQCCVGEWPGTVPNPNTHPGAYILASAPNSTYFLASEGQPDVAEVALRQVDGISVNPVGHFSRTSNFVGSLESVFDGVRCLVNNAWPVSNALPSFYSRAERYLLAAKVHRLYPGKEYLRYVAEEPVVATFSGGERKGTVVFGIKGKLPSGRLGIFTYVKPEHTICPTSSQALFVSVPLHLALHPSLKLAGGLLVGPTNASDVLKAIHSGVAVDGPDSFTYAGFGVVKDGSVIYKSTNAADMGTANRNQQFNLASGGDDAIYIDTAGSLTYQVTARVAGNGLPYSWRLLPGLDAEVLTGANLIAEYTGLLVHAFGLYSYPLSLDPGSGSPNYRLLGARQLGSSGMYYPALYTARYGEVGITIEGKNPFLDTSSPDGKVHMCPNGAPALDGIMVGNCTHHAVAYPSDAYGEDAQLYATLAGDVEIGTGASATPSSSPITVATT